MALDDDQNHTKSLETRLYEQIKEDELKEVDTCFSRLFSQ